MKLIPILLVASLAALAGCRSNDLEPAPGATPPCTCGTPMADFEGCAHPLCLSGEGNPENPECVCGRLELEQGGGR
jgi:hypothetical protein